MNNTQKTKIQALSKLRLPQDARTLLNKIEKALKGDNKEAKQKGSDALDKLYDKVRELASKQQTIDKGKKVSQRNVKPKSQDIDEESQKKEIEEVANKVIDPLQEIIDNDPKLKGFNKSESDIVIDSGRKALPRGRRVSKKGWKNQYGASKGGRVYYENRENHSDRKAPFTKSSKMPWLEHGGDVDGQSFKVLEVMDGGEYLILENQTLEDARMVAMAYKENNNVDVVVKDYMGNVYYSTDPNHFAEGGYMAKGGEIGDSGTITDKDSFFTGKMGLIVGELDPKTWLVKVGDRTVIVPKKGIDIMPSDDEYAKGGQIKKTHDVEMSNFHKNVLGTLSFDMKLSNMRKAQDFSVYPRTDLSDFITIQSKTRFGKIDIMTGRGLMSESHSSGAYAYHFQTDNLVKFKLTDEQLRTLKDEMAKTKGKNVGTRGIVTDNDYADMLARGGEVDSINEKVEELTTLSNKAWDTFNIISGSQIYASETLQKNLANEYRKIGIDRMYTSLPPSERRRISEILTDINEHSLRNYLALRGYNGMEEYNDYVRMFKESKAMFGHVSLWNPEYVEILSKNYAKGGAIKNQYKGRTPKDIWNNLSESQRRHFLNDHAEEIDEYDDSYTSIEIIGAENSNWDELNESIKESFTYHVREGQYSKGGRLKSVSKYDRGRMGYSRIDGAIGSFGWRYNGKYNDAILYPLSDYDEKMYKDLKLKNGQKMYRYSTERMLGLQQPIVAINKDKMLVYFNVNEDPDDEFPIFTTGRGIKLEYLALDENYFAKGGYVAVSEKDGYWTIISTPTSESKAKELLNMTTIPRGEIGKVVTLQEAKNHKKIIGKEYLYAEGGKLGFEGLAKKVAKNYEGKKVPSKYQDEYGKTYSKEEAMEVGDKVASKVYRQQSKKMKYGGEFAEGGFTEKNILGKYVVKIYRSENGKKKLIQEKVYQDSDGAVTFAMIKNDFLREGESIVVEDSDGNWIYRTIANRKRKMAKGGYMDNGVNYVKLINLIKSADNPRNLPIYYNSDWGVVNIGGVGYDGGDLVKKFNAQTEQSWEIKNLFYKANQYPQETKNAIESMKVGIKVEIGKGYGDETYVKYTKMKFAKGGELETGINTEMKEHNMTKSEATKTAKDHLKEDSKYYSKMKSIGLEKGGQIKLPQSLNRYFKKGSKTISVDMDKLIPTRAREKGIMNAEKYMRMAYDGEMERRKPITIYKSRNGKYRINDGNSTFAVAKKHGWKKIYADVIANPNISKRKENSTFVVAKKIRKEGESWQDAVKRASKLNK